jgi:hypothetical protein
MGSSASETTGLGRMALQSLIGRRMLMDARRAEAQSSTVVAFVSDNNHDGHRYDVVCVCALCKPVLNRIASCWA